MNFVTPESIGLSSNAAEAFIKNLEDSRLSTHDIILSRGDSVFLEHYWKPFSPSFLHRMYSVSKSFVSLAIGFLEQDKIISLDDRLMDYFPEESKNQNDEYFRAQTIRHTLQMTTAKPVVDKDWFSARVKDRVRFYFENNNPYSRPPGTTFQYDSTGSFVLGALVERCTQMPFMQYLREKLFDRIGVSKEAYCLTCPGGHSWGDSAVLCTPMDLWKVARFIMNHGKWNGVQILNENYIKQATAYQVDNNFLGLHEFETCGYGYLIWRTLQNSYFLNGMGCQFAICVPDKDVIMIYNGDNQGKAYAKKIIFDSFFEIIINQMSDTPLKKDDLAYHSLKNYTDSLQLAVAIGGARSDMEKKIHGKVFKMRQNPMGIRSFSLHFSKDGGVFQYCNEQGEKELPFGFRKNVFAPFPQTGYSDTVGSVPASQNQYQCAASAAWTDPATLFIKVQIIDKYFGTLNITFGFQENRVGIHMNKCAEDFLEEYEGFGGGELCE